MLAQLPASSLAAEAMPRRRIPGKDESLPIIGLGSSKPVSQIAERGPGPITGVLRALVDAGGSVVDTWPRNPANDAVLGDVINLPDLRDELFVASKIDRTGRDAGLAQFQETLELYQRDQLDLLQIFSLTDLDTHWKTLRELKDDGKARYIGVTVASESLYDELAAFIGREQPDFVQINYSITEREAESRMLPMLADRGIGVIINRPFVNGDYFARLGDRPLPEWTAEFDCESWAQFSLKYILPHPAVTCVLTETSSASHMAENARAALGGMPDEAQRERMREFIAGV
jgi:diketogulonate reductase-like aldo/keto reductase